MNTEASRENIGYYKSLKATEQFSILDTISCSDMGAFLLCTQGSMRVSINLQEYVLAQNSILTLIASNVFSMEACSPDFEGHLVVFPAAMAESSELRDSLLHLLVQIKERPVLPIADMRMTLAMKYVSLLKSLYGQPEAMAYPVVNGVIHSFLCALYVGYATDAVPSPRTPKNRKQTIFKDFVALVGKHYTTERSVDFYADKLCIRHKYLSMVVKEVYGHTPSYIIGHAVILAAKSKLQTGRYTVQQVAAMLNFDNASFFGKFFKRYVGCAPGQYLSHYAHHATVS